MERCLRGLKSTLGKRVYRDERYRGFKSHPLRHSINYFAFLLFTITDGCARRGASGALNLKSAIAGLNSFLERKIL